MQANNYDDFPPGLDLLDLIFAEPEAVAAVEAEVLAAELPPGPAGDMEHWRAVDGYLNYQVSSHGRVRNVRTGRILRPWLERAGYLTVKLCRDGKAKTFYVHRLVAEAWIPIQNDKPFVDHRDNNKANNVMQNLRWCTRAENNRNQGIRRDNTTGYKGIELIPSGRWRARIAVNGVRINLGMFATKELAAAAYAEAAREHHGEFLNLG